MTSRELRNQRREAERNARKLEYQQSRIAASASAGAPQAAFSPNPDLLDEFSAEEQSEMMALRARVHARTGPTGPRSSEGKATSSGNSLKHGLASGRVIIPGEDPAEFEALLSGLLTEHAPATETESLLVRQMAQSWWLTQRAIRIQNQAFTETRVDTHKLALFLRYQTTHERAFYRAFNSLIKLQKERRKSHPVGSLHASSVSQKRGATRLSQFVSQKTPVASSAEPQSSPAAPLHTNQHAAMDSFSNAAACETQKDAR